MATLHHALPGKSHQAVDRVGGWLSLICAIHCAVVPTLVLLAAIGFPVASELSLIDDGAFELGFSVAAVILVAVSVALGWRTLSDRGPTLVGFAVGLSLIIGSRLAPGPEWISHLVLVVGAITLALTHRRSLRAARTCCPVDPSASAALLP